MTIGFVLFKGNAFSELEFGPKCEFSFRKRAEMKSRRLKIAFNAHLLWKLLTQHCATRF